MFNVVFSYFPKDKPCGAEEMTQWVTGSTALAEDPVQFPAPVSGWLTTAVPHTAPGDMNTFTYI